MNFLSHRYLWTPTKSFQILQSGLLLAFLSLISRRMCAPVCARVASHARACAETILRREYNCPLVRFPFRRNTHGEYAYANISFFRRRAHCASRLFPLSSIPRNRSLMPRRDRDGTATTVTFRHPRM